MRIVGPNGEVDVTAPSEGRVWRVAGGGLHVDFRFDEYDLEAALARDGNAIWVSCEGCVARFTLPDAHGGDTDHEARAPMTGKVVSIPVKIGDEVKRGDTVAVLEAMKMEYKLEAEADGTVEEIGAKEGDLVDLGQLLVKLK